MTFRKITERKRGLYLEYPVFEDAELLNRFEEKFASLARDAAARCDRLTLTFKADDDVCIHTLTARRGNSVTRKTLFVTCRDGLITNLKIN